MREVCLRRAKQTPPFRIEVEYDSGNNNPAKPYYEDYQFISRRFESSYTSDGKLIDRTFYSYDWKTVLSIFRIPLFESLKEEHWESTGIIVLLSILLAVQRLKTPDPLLQSKIGEALGFFTQALQGTNLIEVIASLRLALVEKRKTLVNSDLVSFIRQ